MPPSRRGTRSSALTAPPSAVVARRAKKRTPGATSAPAAVPLAKRAKHSKNTEPYCGLLEGRLSELEALGDTRTRAGWRLADAVRHLASVGGGSLVPLINKHGFPRFCFSVGDDAATSAARPAQQHKEGEGYHTTFVSLARAIVGQQLAGAAVRKIWGRFEAQFTTPGADHRPQISPAAFRRLTSSAAKLEALRSAVGLSGAKARALVSLSDFYADGRLSDAQLLEGSASPDELCEQLTAVRGIGNWTAQMFMMFTLHLPDVLPLGDLGVRNGIAKHFGLKGHGKRGSLHEVKDGERCRELLAPFRPYRSLVSWYMWRALETESYDEAMR